MKYDLVIKNGNVCTENGMLKGGLAIKDGVIQAYVTDSALPEAEKYYDANGNIIFPGVVEPHSHYGTGCQSREGYIKDLYSETRAAVQGGVTTVNTTTLLGAEPLHSYYEWAQEGIKNIYSNVKFYLDPGNDEHFAEMEDLVKIGGPCAFKFLLGYRGASARMFGMVETGFDTGTIYRAFKKVAEAGIPAFAMIHAEDPGVYEIVTEKVKNEPTDNYLAAFNKARPSICEAIDICKAAYIANEVKCPLYVVHISAKESVDQVAYFKKMGFDITGETCIHYLMFDCNDKMFVNNDDFCKFAKVNPPIRGAADRERLWLGIKEGIITHVGTDHVNYTREQKLTKGFWDTICGCGDGDSVLLSLMFSEGVNKGRITIETLRKILCENPARSFGIYPQKGSLNIGSDADIVIIDPNKEMVIDHKDSESTNEFSLYQGWKVKGVPVATFVNGHLVVENYKVVDEEPHGKLVHHGQKNTKLL